MSNELTQLKTLDSIEHDSIVWNENSVELWLSLEALGLTCTYKGARRLVQDFKLHRIYIKINRSFPYPGGIDFSWYSEIFHPNIHPVIIPGGITRGTGYICLNVLRKWSKLTDLETTIKALQKLVENPNPEDPLEYEICLQAAEYFTNNLDEKKMSEDDDDIIILDE